MLQQNSCLSLAFKVEVFLVDLDCRFVRSPLDLLRESFFGEAGKRFTFTKKHLCKNFIVTDLERAGFVWRFYHHMLRAG